MELNGRVYPSLALAAVAMATSTRDAALRVATVNHVTLVLGQRVVPLDGKSNLLLRFRGQKRTLPYTSAADVIAGRTPPASVQDRIAFVGTTALGTSSVVATPLDSSFVGLEVQATLADNLLQQDFVHRPIRGKILESLAVVGLGVSVTLLAAKVGLLASALAALAGVVLLWAIAIWLLSTSGAFLSPFYPTCGIVLAFLIVTVGKARIEHRRADMAIRRIESTVLNR
jgi:adenylate cyclase